MFGYQTKAQYDAFDLYGWDDENSAALIVDTDDKLAAARWGQEVAEAFVKWLFGDESVSWKSMEFAWTLSPASEDTEIGLVKVAVGEMPDFNAIFPR